MIKKKNDTIHFYSMPNIQKQYCNNCGLYGHNYKKCKKTIISYGIIAIYRSDVLITYDNSIQDIIDSSDKMNFETNGLYYLVICRSHTMGYVDIVRGRYSNEKIIQNYINNLTYKERYKLQNSNFNDLWDDLWVNKESKFYINEKDYAKSQFEKLNISKLLENSIGKYKTPEWGFPKGRRNSYETDLQCAKREFMEETGYTNADYKIINVSPIEETYTGTNDIEYTHKYYIALMNQNIKKPCVNYNNITQRSEVSNVALLNINDCLEIFRPYDTEKKDLLIKLHTFMSNKK